MSQQILGSLGEEQRGSVGLPESLPLPEIAREHQLPPSPLPNWGQRGKREEREQSGTACSTPSESEQWPFFAFRGFIIARLAKARGVNPPWSTARFAVPAPCLPVPGIVENYRLLLPGLPHGPWQGQGTNRPLARPGEHREESPRPVVCAMGTPGCAMGTRVCPGCPWLGRVGTAPPGLLHGHLLTKSIPCSTPAASFSWESTARGNTASSTREKPWWEGGNASTGYAGPRWAGEQLPSGMGARPSPSLEPGWESGSCHAPAEQTGPDRHRTGSPAPSCWDTG